MSREVEETDVFHFNDQFHSKLFKIKVGTITAQKESEPEKLETRQKASLHQSCSVSASKRPARDLEYCKIKVEVRSRMVLPDAG